MHAAPGRYGHAGSVAPIVGTIVGAFFGVQAGSSGKEPPGPAAP
jgi:hypothetical protein